MIDAPPRRSIRISLTKAHAEQMYADAQAADGEFRFTFEAHADIVAEELETTFPELRFGDEE